jgi:homoserine acetyltransferase
VESYLQTHADRFIGAFDANCYLYLSRAMDLFDGLDHGGSLSASFNDLRLESAMVIGVATDALFPLSQQQELAEALQEKIPEVVFSALDSIQGHDSFLVDMDRFRPAIAAYF